MNVGRTLFSQLIDPLPLAEFRKCVARYRGNHRVRSFTCWDQFLCMAFAQVTGRESLRDSVVSLRSIGAGLYHMGIRGQVSRSNLADANESRDWRIFADFARALIPEARRLHQDHDLGLALDHVVYALDATIIDLCMSLFPWAVYRSDQHAIKLHTQLDLRGNIPTFLRISPAKTHDVHFLDHLVIEPGAFYVMDRGYLDFARLFRFTLHAAFFVTRPRGNFRFRRLASMPVEWAAGVRCDQAISLVSFYSRQGHPQPLRRVGFYDAERDRRLVFITNNFTLPARTIADLYRLRWQVELFFKWIKQHLRIKAFCGTSDNAVKTQTWIAVCVYLAMLIAHRRLKLEIDLHTMVQVLSIKSLQKTPAKEAFSLNGRALEKADDHNQLCLFDF